MRNKTLVATMALAVPVMFGVTACGDTPFKDLRLIDGTVAYVGYQKVLPRSYDYIDIRLSGDMGMYRCDIRQAPICATLREGHEVFMDVGHRNNRDNVVASLFIIDAGEKPQQT